MKLTSFGKKVTFAVLTALVLAAGFFCVTDNAHMLGMGQYAYNIIYMWCVLPAYSIAASRLIDLSRIIRL